MFIWDRYLFADRKGAGMELAKEEGWLNCQVLWALNLRHRSEGWRPDSMLHNQNAVRVWDVISRSRDRHWNMAVLITDSGGMGGNQGWWRQTAQIEEGKNPTTQTRALLLLPHFLLIPLPPSSPPSSSPSFLCFFLLPLPSWFLLLFLLFFSYTASCFLLISSMPFLFLLPCPPLLCLLLPLPCFLPHPSPILRWSVTTKYSRLFFVSCPSQKH